MVVEFFTFGMGHELAGHVQPIKADSAEIARNEMFRIHGKKWAFQYSEQEYLDARLEGHARETVLEPIILKDGSGGDIQIILRTCQGCRETKHLEVKGKDMNAWENGAHIQTVMPYLSAGDRELLISGFCGTCFDKLFETV